MKKADAIAKVQESVGSLFTKEDVINLINQIQDEQAKVDFDELKERIEAIINDADDDEIEVDTNRCSFEIQNGNEIMVDDVRYDTDNFKSNIIHDIEQLIEGVKIGEACQIEEA
jgi:hypothetical protein